MRLNLPVAKTSFELRPYQRECVDYVMSDFASGKEKVAAILPTGAGKTEIFVEIAKQWTENNPGDSVLVLSHLSLLTQQTLRRFQLRAPELNVGILQADRVPDRDDRVVISTMQSGRDAKRAHAFKQQAHYKVGLVIVDEAHYLTTESYNAALMFHHGARVLGVTATPFRERKLMTSWFDKVSFSISLQSLIDQGYLVKPVLRQFTRKADTPEETMAQVIALYKEYEAGKKAIVFARSIEEAKTLRTAFVNAGVRARAVTSELTGESRDDVLGDFETSDTMVLTTVNVLSAGFDAPCLEAIFMPYPTDSPTLYMQRVGRGLRPSPGKADCRVYVMGDAPSISKQIYERVQEQALKGKAEHKEYDNYLDDLRLNDPEASPELYKWTETIVEVAKKMEKLGLRELASLLVTKQFPKKFLDNLEKIEARLIHVPTRKDPEPLSEKQAAVLQGWGFENPHDMTKQEASSFISAVLSFRQQTDKFVIQSGKYEGKHVSQLPWAYQRVILNKFPGSGVAKQIAEWNDQKRKA